jgi:hypothetical protein
MSSKKSETATDGSKTECQFVGKKFAAKKATKPTPKFALAQPKQKEN